MAIIRFSRSRRRRAAMLGGSVLVVVGIWLAREAAPRMALAQPPLIRGSETGVTQSHVSRTDGIEARRQPFAAQPRTADALHADAAQARRLARVRAQRALALANREVDPEQRHALMLAAVEAWANVDPAESVAWSDALPDGDRELALAAAFRGAVTDPTAAVQLARELCLQRPERAGDYGQDLITALAAVNAHAEAAEFAAATRSSELREEWLQDAYFHWAEQDAVAALAASAALDDPELRHLALRGLVAGWAAVQPGELADYALLLPEGELRAEALKEALPQWVARDSTDASGWLQHQDAVAAFDSGAAALASDSRLASLHPDVAARWAASIADPTTRTNALRNVAIEWGRNDPAALEHFIEHTPDLREPDRVALREGLNPPPDA